MPWTPAQHRLFEFVAHSPAKAAAEGIKIGQATAQRMASEGIKKTTPTYPQRLAKRLMK